MGEVNMILERLYLNHSLDLVLQSLTLMKELIGSALVALHLPRELLRRRQQSLHNSA